MLCGLGSERLLYLPSSPEFLLVQPPEPSVTGTGKFSEAIIEDHQLSIVERLDMHYYNHYLSYKYNMTCSVVSSYHEGLEVQYTMWAKQHQGILPRYCREMIFKKARKINIFTARPTHK